MVEQELLRLSPDEGHESGCRPGLTWLVDILLYGLRVDHHYCVYLVGDPPAGGGWQDGVFASAIVKEAKRDKHAQTYANHRFDFVPF